jgi:hypothetical protein
VERIESHTNPCAHRFELTHRCCSLIAEITSIVLPVDVDFPFIDSYVHGLDYYEQSEQSTICSLFCCCDCDDDDDCYYSCCRREEVIAWGRATRCACQRNDTYALVILCVISSRHAKDSWLIIIECNLLRRIRLSSVSLVVDQYGNKRQGYVCHHPSEGLDFNRYAHASPWQGKKTGWWNSSI